jgi:hypothetical protein
MYDPVSAGTGEQNRSNREIHGYDLQERLEPESLDRGSTASRADSAYDEFWLGEEGTYPVS